MKPSNTYIPNLDLDTLTKDYQYWSRWGNGLLHDMLTLRHFFEDMLADSQQTNCRLSINRILTLIDEYITHLRETNSLIERVLTEVESAQPDTSALAQLVRVHREVTDSMECFFFTAESVKYQHWQYEQVYSLPNLLARNQWNR